MPAPERPKDVPEAPIDVPNARKTARAEEFRKLVTDYVWPGRTEDLVMAPESGIDRTPTRPTPDPPRTRPPKPERPADMTYEAEVAATIRSMATGVATVPLASVGNVTTSPERVAIQRPTEFPDGMPVPPAARGGVRRG